jgi:penicillin-binding protein 2
MAILLSVFLGYTGRVNAEEVKAASGYGPTDLGGQAGARKAVRGCAAGQNGGERTEVDATGKPIRVLASRDPVPGNNLVLSIDQGLAAQDGGGHLASKWRRLKRRGRRGGD